MAMKKSNLNKKKVVIIKQPLNNKQTKYQETTEYDDENTNTYEQESEKVENNDLSVKTTFWSSSILVNITCILMLILWVFMMTNLHYEKRFPFNENRQETTEKKVNNESTIDKLLKKK